MNLIKQDTHPPSDFRISYCAGYFDGEGCIWIDNRIRSPQLRISVVSGDIDSLKIFARLFGGNVFPVTSKSSRVNIFRWSQDNSFAVKCLEKMLPFMYAKREQAQMVVSSGWPIFARGSILPMQEVARRLNLRSELKEAKRRGLKVRGPKVEVLKPLPIVTGKCRNCGAIFTPLRRTRKYCSLKCNKQFTGRAYWMAKKAQRKVA
jgi:hypothetical protein